MSVFFQKLKQFFVADWIGLSVDYYKNIDSVYRRSFWILFVVTNIVFGFHTVNFFWGPDDWVYMIKGTSIGNGFWEGRYGQFVITEILTGNKYLPFLSSMLSFAALSLSSVMLGVYWKLPRKLSYFVIFGLVLNITPYTYAWLDFAHWTVNIFFARLMIVSGLVLAEKSAGVPPSYSCSGKSGMMTAALFLASVLLLNFGISVYPSLLESAVLILTGRVLTEMLKWESVRTGVKSVLRTFSFSVAAVFVSLDIFLMIYQAMKKNGWIRPFYNSDLLFPSEIKRKFVLSIQASIDQFLNYSAPFYPAVLTKLFLALAVIFFIQILLSKRKLSLKLSILSVFFAALFLTKTVFFLAEFSEITYEGRVEFCGYGLFNGLIVASGLRSGGAFQNIRRVIGCIIIYTFIVSSLYQQRTAKFGWDAEKMLWNRMLARVESHPDYNPEKEYSVLQIGNPVSARKNYYDGKDAAGKGSWRSLASSFDSNWRAFNAPVFYGFIFVKRLFHQGLVEPDAVTVLKSFFDAGLLDEARPWPDKNAVMIKDDVILVVTDGYELQNVRAALANMNKTP